MSRQDQNVSEGAAAYQAGGNITVTQGLTPGQMLEIMEAVSNQIQKFEARAEETFRERIKEFHEKVLREFAREGSPSNSQAFEDPDYQFVLREAQNSFGRSGDELLGDELARLLAERSGEAKRTRKALALNEAIGTVGNLTEQEFSSIAILFTMKNIHIFPPDRSSLCSTLAEIFEKFIDQLPKENFSYEYLESMRCLSINSLSSIDFWQIISANYASSFTKGISLPELHKLIPNVIERARLNSILTPLDEDFSGNLVKFHFKDRELIESNIRGLGYGPEIVAKILDMYDGSLMDADAVRSSILARSPIFGQLSDIWSASPLRSANLTALGKVIGHSALTSRTNFQAPLEIWVQ